MKNYYINPDIKKAETLPAEFYRSQEVFDFLIEQLFERSFQWLGDYRDYLNPEQNAYPMRLNSEPIIMVSNGDDCPRIVSNVCTHRANIVLHNPSKITKLSCAYHGRQFSLEGKFKRMPEFREAENFPRPCDDLFEFKTQLLGPHVFAASNPNFDFKSVIDNMNERIGFLPLEEFKMNASLNKDYIVNAHWALYCDNYLEGFHIPFVHADLNEALDYGSYETLLYPNMSLQIGYSDDPKSCFELPDGHPDFGKNVAAYYYWLFPNMMFNFYPWGLSVNLVKPQTKTRTKVSFYTYVWKQDRLDQGAGALLDKVEREDEFVVEGVQSGLESRVYKTGRFSPTREQGVHHFHRMLAELFK